MREILACLRREQLPYRLSGLSALESAWLHLYLVLVGVRSGIGCEHGYAKHEPVTWLGHARQLVDLANISALRQHVDVLILDEFG